MNIKQILPIIGIFAGAFILGHVSKTCIKCVECEICLPCKPEVIIEKEIIIKKLKNEIHDIHISSDRKFRDSLRRAINPR